jgi:hypothetical protein
MLLLAAADTVEEVALALDIVSSEGLAELDEAFAAGPRTALDARILVRELAPVPLQIFTPISVIIRVTQHMQVH